jgi:hypothetical protein
MQVVRNFYAETSGKSRTGCPAPADYKRIRKPAREKREKENEAAAWQAKLAIRNSRFEISNLSDFTFSRFSRANFR